MARARPDGPPDEAGPDFLKTRFLCQIPSLFSACVSTCPLQYSLAAGRPAPPSPASSRTWTLRPSNGVGPFRGMGKQDARPDRDAGQALPELDVLGQGASCR